MCVCVQKMVADYKKRLGETVPGRIAESAKVVVKQLVHIAREAQEALAEVASGNPLKPSESWAEGAADGDLQSLMHVANLTLLKADGERITTLAKREEGAIEIGGL